MKFLRLLLKLVFFSLALSALLYYFTAGVIRSSWTAILGEIFTTAIILFIFFLIAYVIVKSVFKTAKAVQKKSPPKNQEGPKL